MKNSIIKLTAIAMMSAASFVSCVQDLNMKNTQPEPATRSALEKDPNVDYFYLESEKRYLDVRRDRVMIRTSSIDEAKKLSEQGVFLAGTKAVTHGRWIIASAEDKKTDLTAVLNPKENDAFDVAV